MRIGVLGLQGDFREHIEMLQMLGIETLVVKLPEQLDMIDGLIIPGGESTTMGRIMKEVQMDKKLIEKVNEGFPIYGTCAGMILLSKKVVNFDQFTLGVLNITVERNAYGRQIESFEVDINIKGISKPFRAVFIRAPKIIEYEKSVEVLAEHEGSPVLVREGKILASSFHPELTKDTAVHKLFLDMIRG